MRRDPGTVISDCAKNVVAGAKQHGVKRVVLESGIMMSDGTDLSLLSRLAIDVFGAFLSKLKANPALLRPDAAVSSSMAKEQFGAWIRGNSIGPSRRSPRNTS